MTSSIVLTRAKEVAEEQARLKLNNGALALTALNNDMNLNEDRTSDMAVIPALMSHDSLGGFAHLDSQDSFPRHLESRDSFPRLPCGDSAMDLHDDGCSPVSLQGTATTRASTPASSTRTRASGLSLSPIEKEQSLPTAASASSSIPADHLVPEREPRRRRTSTNAGVNPGPPGTGDAAPRSPRSAYLEAQQRHDSLHKQHRHLLDKQKQALPVETTLEQTRTFWSRLAGGKEIGYDHDVYTSERETADRNFALAHFMNEQKAYPSGVTGRNLKDVLSYYFKSCSMTLNVDALSVVAATMANGGVCPLTNERVLDVETVKHCLSMMYSCGMYDYSGEFAFTIGRSFLSLLLHDVLVWDVRLFGRVRVHHW